MIPIRTIEPLGQVIRLGLFGILFLSPLPFGSVPRGSVLVLELWAAGLGLLSLGLVWINPEAFPRAGRWLLAIAGVVIAIGVVQLIPAPPGWTRLVAPRTAEVRDAVAAVLPVTNSSWMPMTIEAPATLDALLRFVAYVFVGLSAVVSIRTDRDLRSLAMIVALTGAFQGFYGAAEYLSGHQHIFGYAKVYMLDSATGTFINRNHYAGYLAMTLPFALALVLSGSRSLSGTHRWRQWVVGLFGPRGVASIVGALSGALAWIGILLSYSRAGLAAGLVAIGLGMFMMGRVGRGRMLVAAALGMATLFILLQEVLVPGYRFAADSEHLLQVGGRLPAWRHAIEMVADYSFSGSGLGTFQFVFPLYRPPAITKFWDHAHNDWLEGAIEMGIPGLAAIACLTVLALRRQLSGSRVTPERSMYLTASIVVVLVVGAMALIDFTLRIPGAAVLATVAVSVSVCQPGAEDRVAPDQHPAATRPAILS